jgi:hypothetical protein
MFADERETEASDNTNGVLESERVHHSACGAEHEQSPECGGPADHAARRIGDQSAEAKARRTVIRVDENGRDVKEGEVARDGQGWVAGYLHRSGLQPLPIAKTDGGSVTLRHRCGPAERIERPQGSQARQR